MRERTPKLGEDVADVGAVPCRELINSASAISRIRMDGDEQRAAHPDLSGGQTGTLAPRRIWTGMATDFREKPLLPRRPHLMSDREAAGDPR